MAEAANPSSPANASVIRSPSLKSRDQTNSPPLSPRNRKRTNSTASTASNTSSGEACCAICLGKPENKCYTNSCLHHFCFACLLEWSKVKPECPLCKQKFKSIIHNVRSLEEFDEYHVRALPEEVNPELLSRFRYRTTLTADRRRQDFSLQRAGLPHRPVRRRVATSDFRRSIYEDDVWARPVADITGRYRETNPAFYRENPAVTHRLIPWLNRELNALLAGRPRVRSRDWDISHVLQTVMDLITNYHIRSPEFASAIRPYLGQYTDHFVHEFYNFARSPLDMIGYDMEVEYGPYTAPENVSIPVEDNTTDSEDSDIVFMGRHHTVPEGPDFRSRLLRGAYVRCTRLNVTTPAEVDFTNILRFLNEHRPFSPPVDNIASSRVSRDASATQSPQPGPSGLQPRFSGRSTPALDSDSEDIEIVDVLKPKRERTPEVVTLSDTDGEEDSGVSVQPSEPTPSTSSVASSEYQATPSTSVSVIVPRYAETSTSPVPSSSSTSSRHTSKHEDQKTEKTRRSRIESEDSVDRRQGGKKRTRRLSSSSPEPSQERGKAWRSNGPAARVNAKKEEKSKQDKKKAVKSIKKSRRSRSPTPRKRRRVLERSSSSSESETEKRVNPVRRRPANRVVTLPRYWDLAEPSTGSSSSSRRDTTYTERSQRSRF